MNNPVLVEVTRGGRAESRHRGAVAIVDADGRAVLSLGAVGDAVFPRSAVKALQALPLVESGAADAFGFGEEELALAQASHGGEPAHVELAASMLARVGLGEADLECGAHKPMHPASAGAMIRRGEPANQLHNNCSGKHANFLALARHLNHPHGGYVEAGHPVQQAVRDVLEALTGASHGASACGIDGCSIPTYAVPLTALALGFARLATGQGLPPMRAAAAERLYRAAVRQPYFVAGTGRFDTDVMSLLDGKALLKTGAEGVYCAALPGAGLGVALKCEDGGTRAAEAMMAAVLARLLPEHETELRRWTHAPVETRRGVKIGEVGVAAGAFALS
jgi:L-asparaginase II